MTYSDYLDIEIIASRKGVLPSQEMTIRKKMKRSNMERQKRFHESHEGYRTEQSKRFREAHPGYYTNANLDRSDYYRRYYQSRKSNV